ncbi:YARHG domain-containing protein [Flavobacterium humi]|uniref:YARHG domain-containing protein n=1 Tax=Flavobacterium humi TaxID=2562683 RepID=A0A4Z0L8J9_9FLAO|nr:YARHG domain-containing protein [Flavobacterium humi]TGD58874.1 YARHG domain-containing protein [Flavobacterium humi]
MKKILLLLIVPALFSCQKETKKTAALEKPEVELHKELYGNWVGDFTVKETDTTKEVEYVYSNKINILIKSIVKNKVTGQSIVAGNTTPFLGTVITVKNGELAFELKELGNGKNNGVFTFNIKNDTLSGLWVANDKNAVVKSREFQLVKQEFKYDPTRMLPNERDYIDYYSAKRDSVTETFEDGEEISYEESTYRAASEVITQINTSTTKLTEEDVKNLKKLELEILRNTIFARHGYTFKKKSYRQFFDPVDWYVPVSNDVSKDLTAIEKSNIALLERFEKYAEDNYDTFGR